MTFDQLAGQTSIKTILRQQLKEDKVSHNYLFTGGRGTGKTSTARLLAKSVNATVIGSDGLPDLLHDPVSLQIDKNQSLDIIEIDAASHTGVDNVREEIIQKSSYPPSQLKKKVYIIDEVHMLSKSAFNALLKIMEEPPAWIMFILATTEYHKVPDTIISRCQVFHFQQLSHDEMVKHLSYIADTEKLVYDQEWLSMIARYTGGAMRDAIKYLEQLAMFHDATAEQVRNFLGIASSETIHDLVTMLRRGDVTASIDFVTQLYADSLQISQLIKDCMRYASDHFMDDQVWYSKFAKILQQLSQDLRWYPDQLLAWKIAISELSRAE
jgi:DNA polymerase-3 subunit gamma/tau